MGRKINEKGNRYGRLLVCECAGKNKRNALMWKCICDCGKETTVRGSDLRNGSQVSCGCYAKEQAVLRMSKHGMSKSSLYALWKNIKTRCYNPNTNCSKYYFEKRIKVCDEWRNNFKSFYDWAINNGWKKELEIDRINSNGDYEPNNCRFVTDRVNTLNRQLLQVNNTSGYRGVNWNNQRNKWQARITVNGKRILIGFHEFRFIAALKRDYFILDNNLQNEYKLQIFKKNTCNFKKQCYN